MPKPILLILSAHSDDMMLSVGGLLRSLKGKATIHALTLFSESEWVHPQYTLGLDNVSAIRRAEDAAYCSMMGIHFTAGGFNDAMRRGFTPEHLLNDSYAVHALHERELLKAVKEKISEQINIVKPDLLMCPAAVGSHIDHIIVRHAASEIARDTGIDLFIYEDLPYAYRVQKDEYKRLAAGAGATGRSYGKSVSTLNYARKIFDFRFYRSQMQISSQIGYVLRGLMHGGFTCIQREQVRAYRNTPYALQLAAMLGLEPLMQNDTRAGISLDVGERA